MQFQALAGLLAFSVLAWLLSENRRAVRWLPVAVGVGLQLAVAALLLHVSLFRHLFLAFNRAALILEEATKAGTSMVFGYLGGGPLPYSLEDPASVYVLAFRALPLVVVISALSALLFHWKILPVIVRGFAWALQRSMKIGGALGLGVAANVFVGMVESPLFIRPYLKNLTRSELFSLMTCGMATIAGTVMVLYASLLSTVVPNIMGHILTASIISVPAAVTISRIMVPETDEPTAGRMVAPEPAQGAMDALTRGTLQGVELLINIVAMLIVLVACIHLVNLMLGQLPEFNGGVLTLQRVLGWLMAPVVWLMGIPWAECPQAGSLMATKTVLNELLAYLQMAKLPAGSLSPSSLLVMTYAMCGFANPGSLGIMIGGLGTMAPERRGEVVSLGFRSIVAGTLATMMTGAVVALLGV